MKAIHGGKAKNDRIDSHKIAGLLRGGLVPQAYVYPATMRSTRDLLRRRLHLVRKRGQLLVHIQNTRAQYNLPAFAKRLAYPGNRDGVVAHFPNPSVRKSIDVDVTLIDQYDALVTDLELTIVREAKRHDGDAFHRLRSVPGIGKILALTILYEIHDIRRFGRVQECASYARLVKGQKQSAGRRLGTSGAKMGHVHLKWAFAVARFRSPTTGRRRSGRLTRGGLIGVSPRGLIAGRTQPRSSTPPTPTLGILSAMHGKHQDRGANVTKVDGVWNR